MSIFKLLESLGVASKESSVLLSDRTRDRLDLKVWRDSVSGVIYIDNFYVGDEIYEAGDYRLKDSEQLQLRSLEYDLERDAKRRANAYQQFFSGKVVADFGCGQGVFLDKVSRYCKSITGIELQSDYVSDMRERGHKALRSLAECQDDFFDAIFAFHVVEHLHSPVEVLEEIKIKMKSGSKLIVEVPHANDFLLSTLNIDDFKKFTLWSQHLILHTRGSLERLLNAAGFSNVLVEGVQRYPLSNHLGWAVEGKPGGHKSDLSMIDSQELNNAYASSLARLNLTDTLVAIATKS